MQSAMPGLSGCARSALLALVLLLPVACGQRPDPEQALRETVSALEQAMNERDAAAIGARLATDFAGPDGMDAQQARRLAGGLFLRYRTTRVQLSSPKVTLHGSDRATVELQAVLMGGGEGLLPESGQLYAVTSGWRMEQGEWRLLHASWTAAF